MKLTPENKSLQVSFKHAHAGGKNAGNVSAQERPWGKLVASGALALTSAGLAYGSYELFQFVQSQPIQHFPIVLGLGVPATAMAAFASVGAAWQAMVTFGEYEDECAATKKPTQKAEHLFSQRNTPM